MLYSRNNVETIELVRYVPKMDSSRSQKRVAFSMTCCGQGVVRQVIIKKLQNLKKFPKVTVELYHVTSN